MPLVPLTHFETNSILEVLVSAAEHKRSDINRPHHSRQNSKFDSSSHVVNRTMELPSQRGRQLANVEKKCWEVVV